MKSYVLSWTDCGETVELNAKSDADAIAQAVDRVIGRQWEGAPVVADQWDADGVNDDEPCKRILIWADEESADNDDGQQAVAQLSTIGRA